MNKRREFLFLYDVSYANPNGDPANENQPRIDEETGILYVRDARLKRTIRDQLASMDFKVFLKEERKEDGKLKTKADLFEEW